MKKNKMMILNLLFFIFLTSCEYSVTHLYIFHTNSDQEIESVAIKNEEVNLYQLPTPIKEGYTFDAWYFDSDLTNEYTSSKVYKSDYYIELFAKYSINEYSVNFHISDTEIIERKYNYDDLITPPEVKKEDYIFDGWYLDNNYESPFNYNLMPAKNLDLYAKWINAPTKETYLVFYGYYDEIYDPMLISENNVDDIKLPTPIKEGYTFDTWYLDKELNNKFLIDNINFDENIIVLYAKFIVNEYILTINTGIDEKYTQNIEYGTKIQLPDDLEKTGYTFGGWYCDENYINKFEYETMPAKNINAYALWLESSQYRVTISSNIVGAFSFEGDIEQIISAENPSFNDVLINENLGYKFSHFEIDGVKYSSNIITLDKVEKNINIMVYAIYATYELPIINIDTQSEEINSKTDYTDMTFSISNCDTELKDISGGIRLRGNSTRRLPKKPYRIKFDKKQSLFGLEKSKSWVLLADYLDPSGLHNYTAFKLASELDGLSFTPSPFKVNVYLNGEFNGLYTLCEQVQENEGRMNIEEEITEEMSELKDFNFFICMDKSVTEDSDSVLDETYFYVEEYDKYFELKYPEKDSFVSEGQFNKFFKELKEYVKNILDIFVNKDVEAIKKEANINSLIDYLIIDQIMGEMDHAYKSFNMYYCHSSENSGEVNKLSFGPIWDYDWSLYTPWTGNPNQSYVVSEKISYSNYFFKAMEQVPEFYQMVKIRYTDYASKILEDYLANLYEFEAQIDESIELNRQKWYTDYSEDISSENIKFLNKYLLRRKILLDETWKK